ncbi:MAG: response regulator [Sphingomonadales bacterium]|nr:response regulator [Sphingomonadales bacterium]MDE2171028.1 response regulator [Sphingomonadales bacterium]
MGKSLIAVVDDDALVRSATVSLLRSMDHDCCAFATAEAFLSETQRKFHCVVSDMEMPGMSGLELARHLATRDHPPPVVLITAYPDARALAARASGLVVDMIEKPLDSEAFLAAVESALARS